MVGFFFFFVRVPNFTNLFYEVIRNDDESHVKVPYESWNEKSGGGAVIEMHLHENRDPKSRLLDGNQTNLHKQLEILVSIFRLAQCHVIEINPWSLQGLKSGILTAQGAYIVQSCKIQFLNLILQGSAAMDEAGPSSSQVRKKIKGLNCTPFGFEYH